MDVKSRFFQPPKKSKYIKQTRDALLTACAKKPCSAVFVLEVRERPYSRNQELFESIYAADTHSWPMAP